MIDRIKEINIDRKENKVLLFQVIIWLFLVSISEMFPDYINILPYLFLIIFATNITYKNKKLFIPLVIYILIIGLGIPFIGSNHIRNVLENTSVLMLSILSISYLFKDKKGIEEIFLAKLSKVSLAFLYFLVTYGLMYGILKLIEFLLSSTLNDVTFFNIIFGVSSSLGLFVAFYQKDDEDEKVPLYINNKDTSLIGTLIIKVLPPLMVIFNVLGIIAATKGIYLALIGDTTNGIEWILSVLLFGFNHLLAFYKNDKLQRIFRYVNFYYILYALIITMKKLSPFKLYPAFLIVWFLGYIIFINYKIIKDNNYQKIPKMVIIFLILSFFPFIGVANNEYLSYLNNREDKSFKTYLKERFNTGKSPYEEYLVRIKQKPVDEKDTFDSIYFNGGYVLKDKVHSFNIGNFNKLNYFESKTMRWGNEYVVENFNFVAKGQELNIISDNKIIWTLDLKTGSEVIKKESANQPYIEIQSESGIVLISNLEIFEWDSEVIRWNIKGIIIN